MKYSEIIPEAFQSEINMDYNQNINSLYNNQNNTLMILGSMMQYQNMNIDIFLRNQYNNNNLNNEFYNSQNNQNSQKQMHNNNQNNIDYNNKQEQSKEKGKNIIKDENNEKDCEFSSVPQSNKENISSNQNVIITKQINEKEEENEKNENELYEGYISYSMNPGIIRPEGGPFAPHHHNKYTPHGSPLYPPYKDIYAPHGGPLYNPFQILPHHGPQNIGFFSPHDMQVYPSHGSPNYPHHGTPIYPTHFQIPHGAPIHPPHGKSIYPHENPLYPPQRDYYPRGIPNYPSKEESLHKIPSHPTKEGFPQDIPLYPLNEEFLQYQINSLNNNIDNNNNEIKKEESNEKENIEKNNNEKEKNIIKSENEEEDCEFNNVPQTNKENINQNQNLIIIKHEKEGENQNQNIDNELNEGCISYSMNPGIIRSEGDPFAPHHHNNYPQHEPPLCPPYKDIYAPHGGPIYGPQNIGFFPPHDMKIYPSHGSSNYPHHAPIYSTHFQIPHGVLIHPPHGRPIYPHGNPLYPPQRDYYPHGIPNYKIPSHQTKEGFPQDIPLYPLNEEFLQYQINSLNNNIDNNNEIKKEESNEKENIEKNNNEKEKNIIKSENEEEDYKFNNIPQPNNHFPQLNHQNIIITKKINEKEEKENKELDSTQENNLKKEKNLINEEHQNNSNENNIPKNPEVHQVEPFIPNEIPFYPSYEQKFYPFEGKLISLSNENISQHEGDSIKRSESNNSSNVAPILQPKEGENYPPYELPFYAPHGTKISPPNRAFNYPPHWTSNHPIHKGDIYPPNGIPVYPSYMTPIYPSHGAPIYPSHGMPIYSPYEDSIHLLNGKPIYPHHPIYPPHGELIHPPNGNLIHPPHGEPIHSPHGEFVRPLHGEPIHPPYREMIHSSHEEPVHPTQEEMINPPHGESNHPNKEQPHQETNHLSLGIPNYSPYGEQYSPYGESIYQTHGMTIYPPYGEHIYPPHGEQFYPSHGEPIYPPNGKHIYPPYGQHIYPPHGAPIYQPHGHPIYSPHGTPIHPPHGSPEFIYSPHGSSLYPPHTPIFPPQGDKKIPHRMPHGFINNYSGDAYPPNPLGFMNKDEAEINTDNENEQLSNNIPIGIPLNNSKIENNDSLNPNKEKEKESELNSVNGNIISEKQKLGENKNDEENKLYNENSQYYYNLPMEYFAEYGYQSFPYYTYPYPYLYQNIADNNQKDIEFNGMDYNYSSKRNSRRIKKLYTGNNNTILEVNEENIKASLFSSEASKNQEDKKNIDNNKEMISNENKNEKNIRVDENIENIKEINYKKIPLYIDTEINNRFLIDDESICLFKYKENNINVNSFPIIIITEDKMYKKLIDFMEANNRYREFNLLSIMKTKLILPQSSLHDKQYKEYHNLKNENIKKFVNITNSLESPIYDVKEVENIIKIIKNSLNDGELNYNKIIEKWVYTVIDLIVEFIQFKLKQISYYYYCTSCHFPSIYISNGFIEELGIDNKNDLLTINNSIDIYSDLIKLIYIFEYNNKNLKNVESIINVLYYEEQYNYINFSFEEEINGIFIPCNNMKSFDRAMNEIHDKNLYNYQKNSEIKINTKNNYMFELIIADVYIDKIFNYLINSNYFKFFKGICILIDEKESNNVNNNILLQIKKKYANYTKDLYITQNDILTFLKREKEDPNYMSNKQYEISYPFIDYSNYLTKYYKIHQGASVYYNKYSINSYQIIEKIFIDFLTSIQNFKYNNKYNNKNPNIKEIFKNIRKKSKKIQDENKLFNIIKLIENLKDKLKEKDIENNNNEFIDIIIQKYINNYNTFCKDFNYWANNLDQLAHQKICYFIGSLLYNIDNSSFYYKNGDYNEKNNLVLYKEISGNYIDLLLYEKNKNQIITFPSFLFCIENNNNNSKDENYLNNKDTFNITYNISYNLNNSSLYIPIIFDLFDSKLFQLFTFYKITNVKIKHKDGKAIINLEPINKKEYLELKLKKNDAVYYNPNLNIMESIFLENNMNNNSNINQSNLSNSKNNQSDLYITSLVNVSKYLQYFNNQYNTNLNDDATSILLENHNLGNIGLLILSKIKLNELIVLNLDNNNISDLSPLKSANFPKLKKLSLASNNKTPLRHKIKDISPLTNCKFPDLFILKLKNNLINDISYLLFMKFPNLLILDLSYNKIQSVHVFKGANFPKLETLDLCNNLINDITPLIQNLGKKNKILKNIDNNSFINSSNISNSLSNSQQLITETHKKNVVLPNLKILKVKHNKLIIDEGFLMTIKTLRNRGVTILK